MRLDPPLASALGVAAGIALWGVADNAGLAAWSSETVGTLFESRGWFIMLTASLLLLLALGLVVSPYGRIKLGSDDDEPEFGTISWLTMLFAAGMGVSLLFYGAAEPVTHFVIARQYVPAPRAAEVARFVTNLHWGLHAWAIYGMTGMVASRRCSGSRSATRGSLSRSSRRCVSPSCCRSWSTWPVGWRGGRTPRWRSPSLCWPSSCSPVPPRI
jgi:glycine betaine transporter